MVQHLKINQCNATYQQAKEEILHNYMNWHRKSIWQNAALPIHDKNSQQVRNGGEPPQIDEEHLQTTLNGEKLHASSQD